MFTLIGYSASQDSSGSLTTTAALADPHVRVSGNDISIPEQLANVAGVYAIGATMTRAALVSPSIRRRYPFEVFPIDASATPTDPWHFHDVAQSIIGLDVDESLNFQFAESGAGAQRGSGLVWLSDGPISPDMVGEIFTIRATGTTTLATYAWTNCPLTFNDTLPAGTYEVLGMHAISTGAIAARLVFPQYAWRPGVIASTGANVYSGTTFRYGNYGVFGSFTHMTPPTVDFLSSSADTAQTVYLDLRMVSGRLSGPGRS
jgi:hypothetical protein